MKKLILLCAFAPAMGFAQGSSDAVNTSTNRWEISANTGMNTASHDADIECMDGTLTASVAVLRNFNNLQLGVAVDYDVFIDDYYELIPRLVVNRTFNFDKVYIYAGGTAGYTNRQHSSFWNMYNSTTSSGYTVGLQTGVVCRLGNHFALNMEVGVRGVQLWNNSGPNTGIQFFDETAPTSTFGPEVMYTPPSNFFELHIPTRMGLRYTF